MDIHDVIFIACTIIAAPHLTRAHALIGCWALSLMGIGITTYKWLVIWGVF